MKLIVELIRHGETELQAQGRYQGAVDVPLSGEGRRKLTAGREKLTAGRKSLNSGRECLSAREIYRESAVVYVSPLKRARETASILFPEAVQIVAPGLAEMNFGKFEGRNFKEMENDPDYRAWVDGMCLGKCPGGESRGEFCARTCEAFLEVLRQALPKETESLYGKLSIESRETGEGRRTMESRETGEGRRTMESRETGKSRITWESGEKGESRKTWGSGEKGESRKTWGSGETGESRESREKISRLVIVAHGGTQMAVMSRFNRNRFSGEESRESRTDDYYSWQLSCGQGYVLEVQTDGTECSVRVLGIRDYCDPQEYFAG